MGVDAFSIVMRFLGVGLILGAIYFQYAAFFGGICKLLAAAFSGAANALPAIGHGVVVVIKYVLWGIGVVIAGIVALILFALGFMMFCALVIGAASMASEDE